MGDDDTARRGAADVLRPRLLCRHLPRSRSAPLPLPRLPITVRAATVDDLPFMDGLQKLHSKQVGWMPTAQFEGKIRAGHVIVAEATASKDEGGRMKNEKNEAP